MPLTRRFLTLISLFLIAGAPLLALSTPAGDDLEPNRRQLEKIRKDPRRYARLVEELKTFLALPPERQAAIRQLDHDLHEEDSATVARLTRVMQRYVNWLDHLSEKDRAWIEEAPDSPTRLERIDQLRQRQWIDRLPRAEREELAPLQGQERGDRILALRREQTARTQEWRKAFPHWFQEREHPARDGSSELSDKFLVRFALNELTPQERAALHLSPTDPSSRERLKQEYIKRHPEEWKRLQEHDRQKKEEKEKGAP